jgi:ribonuclease HI
MQIVDIYTDGSAEKPNSNKNNGILPALGIGAYCKYRNIEYYYSRNCDVKMLSKYNIVETSISNPTAEFLAFAEILNILVPLSKKPQNNIIIRFHIDYEGVGKWMNNEWQAKKDYIKKLKDNAQKLIKIIGYTIEIVHVKAHTGVQGNELADQFALNGRLNINEINSKYIPITELPFAILKS